MSVLPDPADLYAIADRITGHASAARERAARLDAAVSATEWRGRAAAAFDAEARFVTTTLRFAAGRLDDAAEALRRHAGEVAAILADLAHLATDGVDLIKDTVTLHPVAALSDAGHLVGDGVRLMGDGVQAVGSGVVSAGEFAGHAAAGVAGAIGSAASDVFDAINPLG